MSFFGNSLVIFGPTNKRNSTTNSSGHFNIGNITCKSRILWYSDQLPVLSSKMIIEYGKFENKTKNELYSISHYYIKIPNIANHNFEIDGFYGPCLHIKNSL